MADLMDGIDPQDEQEYLQGLADAVDKYKRQYLGQEFNPGQDSREAVQDEIARIQQLHGVRLERGDPETDQLAAYIAAEKDPQKVLAAVQKAAQAKGKRVKQAPLLREYQKEIAQARGINAKLAVRQSFRRRGLDI